MMLSVVGALVAGCHGMTVTPLAGGPKHADQAACQPARNFFAHCSAAEVCEAMAIMPNDCLVQASGAYALGLHTLDSDWVVDPLLQREVEQAGGIDSVLRAMQRMPNDAAVQSNGCYALGFLAGSANITELPRLASQVLSAVSNAPDDAEVQANGLYALAECTRVGGALQAHNGGVQPDVSLLTRALFAASAAMRRFHSESEVQANGCFLLSEVVVSANGAIDTSEATSLAVEALRKFGDHPMVATFGLPLVASVGAAAAGDMATIRKLPHDRTGFSQAAPNPTLPPLPPLPPAPNSDAPGS